MIQKKCFFSVITKSFIEGFKVFSNSLMRNNPWLNRTKNDMVLVSVDLSDKDKKECEKYYKYIKWIEPEDFPKNFNDESLKIGKCALYKLQAFSLYDYDLVISIDVGDMVVIKPIPEIFAFNTAIGMVQGWTKDHGWHDKRKAGGTFNGGLVLLNKTYRTPEVYKKLINSTPSPYFDQQIINEEFYGKISKLPMALNFSKRLIECKELNMKDASIIHYVGEKPWQSYKNKETYKPIERFWHNEKALL